MNRNSGQISGATFDIWIKKGVASIAKFEDDHKILRMLNNLGLYGYNKEYLFRLIKELGVPWHPGKSDDTFTLYYVTSHSYIQMVDLISLPSQIS